MDVANDLTTNSFTFFFTILTNWPKYICVKIIDWFMKLWNLHMTEYYAVMKSHNEGFQTAFFGVPLDGN